MTVHYCLELKSFSIWISLLTEFSISFALLALQTKKKVLTNDTKTS